MESVEELRRICQGKTKKKRFGYTKARQKKYTLLLRRGSIYFTKLFLKMGMTANQASLLQVIFMFGSMYFLIFLGSIELIVLSAIMINISYFLDLVDGEIARYRGPTRFGRILDTVVHDLYYAIFVFLGYGSYLYTGEILFFILGTAVTVFILFVRLHMLRFEFISSPIQKEIKGNRIVRKLYDITLAKTFMPFMYVAALLGLMQYFVAFYGFYMPFFWLLILVRKRSQFNFGEKKTDEKKFWDNMRIRL